jgi:Uma2 family endonuclease
MIVRTAPRMDKEAFFTWIATQERRFELVDGVPVMLPWVTSNHNRITMNVVEIVLKSLDRDVWDVSAGDFAMETGERSVRFADVMVFPFEPRPDGRSTMMAPLVVEVLSDTTSRTDLGPKVIEYGALPGVSVYAIIAQDRALVQVWRRRTDGSWPGEPETLTDMEAVVHVGPLGIALPLSEIYRRVPLA